MTAALFGLITILGVVLLAVTAVRVLVGGLEDRSARPGRSTRPADRSARRILEDRYAAGELSAQEYQHRLSVLDGKTP